MRQPTFMGSSITTCGGDAQVHGRRLPADPIELAELLLGAGQADLETFDLAEPALRLGFGDLDDQVVADLGKPCPLGRVRSQERTSDAGFKSSSSGRCLLWKVVQEAPADAMSCSVRAAIVLGA